jgi:hypothetical protein
MTSAARETQIIANRIEKDVSNSAVISGMEPPVTNVSADRTAVELAILAFAAGATFRFIFAIIAVILCRAYWSAVSREPMGLLAPRNVTRAGGFYADKTTGRNV